MTAATAVTIVAMVAEMIGPAAMEACRSTAKGVVLVATTGAPAAKTTGRAAMDPRMTGLVATATARIGATTSAVSAGMTVARTAAIGRIAMIAPVATVNARNAVRATVPGARTTARAGMAIGRTAPALSAMEIVSVAMEIARAIRAAAIARARRTTGARAGTPANARGGATTARVAIPHGTARAAPTGAAVGRSAPATVAMAGRGARATARGAMTTVTTAVARSGMATVATAAGRSGMETARVEMTIDAGRSWVVEARAAEAAAIVAAQAGSSPRPSDCSTS